MGAAPGECVDCQVATIGPGQYHCLASTGQEPQASSIRDPGFQRLEAHLDLRAAVAFCQESDGGGALLPDVLHKRTVGILDGESESGLSSGRVDRELLDESKSCHGESEDGRDGSPNGARLVAPKWRAATRRGSPRETRKRPGAKPQLT